MPVKIDVQSQARLPRKTVPKLNALLASLPNEHLLGLERIVLVDQIIDPRIQRAQRSSLPGLYHPRQGPQRAWIEINVSALLGSEGGLIKRLVPRVAFYNNLAAIAVSLVGQHYYLSLRHSIKKGSLEGAIRTYTIKHMQAFNESQHKFRARIFRPLQPTLERWARTLKQRSGSR